MNLQAWIQKCQFSSGIITWFGFMIVMGFFGGYVMFAQKRVRSVEERLRSEIQYLREENLRLSARNQELRQTRPQTETPHAGRKQPEPFALDDDAERRLANERSFLYTIKKGDTIWDIAERYSLDLKALLRWNDLTPRSRIFPGDQLVIILEE